MVDGRMVAIVIILIAIGAGIYYYLFMLPSTSVPPEPVEIVNLNRNPAFVYPTSGWLEELGTSDWYGKTNAYYYEGTIEGRSGIMVIHPVSRTEENYLQQDVFLPTGKGYELSVSLNDVAGKVSFAEPTECNDVRFIIKIIDKDSGQEQTLSNIVVNSVDGWVDLKHDVSEYAGKTVTLSGEYRGWEPGFGSPPVTRSDWILKDETGGIYITGKAPPGLDPVEDRGTEVTVRGVVKVKDGRAYLEAESVG